MKLAILSLLALTLLAEEPKPKPTGANVQIADIQTPTIESLQAEIALLRAQLEAAVKTHIADAAACWSDDLQIVQRRYEAAVAQRKERDLAQKPAAEAKAK